jgi:hypothetical protein
VKSLEGADSPDPVTCQCSLCVTVTVRPAMVSVPERLAPVFRSTWNVTVPEPVFDALDVRAIQLALLAAVHGQLDWVAVTVTDALPPGASTVRVSGTTVKPHVCCAAA